MTKHNSHRQKKVAKAFEDFKNGIFNNNNLTGPVYFQMNSHNSKFYLFIL